jgi:uncharacterized protein YhhL (DUF1145 family)
MSRNRDLAAVFGVLAVAWPYYGFATGFMAQYLPASLQLELWAVNVLILIFLPLVRSTIRWTALGAGIAGIIMIIWVGIEIVILPGFLATRAPVLEVVFAGIFALFALRAYFEKPLPKP